MSHASLCPDPKWRFPAHGCCLSHGLRVVPPTRAGHFSLPGEQQGDCGCLERASTTRADMWAVGAADGVKVKLLLSASASQSLFYYSLLLKRSGKKLTLISSVRLS